MRVRLDYATATHCARGHDLRIAGNMTMREGRRSCAACRRDRDREAKRKRASEARSVTQTCRRCGKAFASTWRKGHCSEACLSATRAANARRQTPEIPLSAGEVDAILSRAVRLESALPWERHPMPWD